MDFGIHCTGYDLHKIQNINLHKKFAQNEKRKCYDLMQHMKFLLDFA